MINNSILWASGGVGGELWSCPGGSAVSYSDVQGGLAGVQGGVIDGGGNIDADPLFVDPDNGDFHLSFDSPCIDVGDNSVVEDGAVDMDGEQRIQHGVVDMGADEFTFCIGDLNGDGEVRVPDLIILLGSWGPCEGCPADLFPDGSVRVTDLIILLSLWGPCK